MTELLKPDFQIHSVDMWGFGESSPIPVGLKPTMEEQADAVIKFLTSEKIEQVRLVGHSMGGGVCLHIVDKLLAPSHKPSITVDKMVLVAPAAFPVSGAAILSMFLGELAISNDEKAIAKSLLKRIYVATVPDIDDYAEKYSVNFTRSRIGSVQEQAKNLGEAKNFASNFNTYNIKTRLIWGRDDPVVDIKNHGVVLEKKLPFAELITKNNCGHAPHEEYPDDVNSDIAEFLK